MSIEIDKGIPIPAHRTGDKYPWREMEVGDSFMLDGKSASKCGNFFATARNVGIKITMRTIRDENGTLIGTRVWRIE